MGGNIRRDCARLGALVATAALTVVLAGCNSGSSKSSASTTTGSVAPADSSQTPASSTAATDATASSAACGSDGTTYSGGGPAAFTIAFTESSDQNSICGLNGKVFVGCAGSSASADHYWTYSDPHATIAEGSDGTFSDKYTLGNGTVTVSGQIGDNGTASGTFLFAEPYCSSQTVSWKVPYSSTASTAASPSDCSPQPCGKVGAFTAAVSGVSNATWVNPKYPASAGQPVWVVDATITNDTSSTETFQARQLTVRPGASTNATYEEKDAQSVTDSQGNVVQCSQGSTSLDAGQSVQVSACFGAVAPAGTPLALVFWSTTTGGSSVAIDLGQAPS